MEALRQVNESEVKTVFILLRYDPTERAAPTLEDMELSTVFFKEDHAKRLAMAEIQDLIEQSMDDGYVDYGYEEEGEEGEPSAMGRNPDAWREYVSISETHISWHATVTDVGSWHIFAVDLYT